MLTPVLDAEQHEKSQSSGRARLHPCRKVLKTGRASAPECTKLGSLEFFGSLLSSEVSDWCKALPRAYWMACGPQKKAP
jgi:hypothetical protein